MSDTDNVKFEVGEVIPPLIVHVTTALVIAGALANRDPQDVHHDRDLTQARGFKDVFQNTMTTTSLITRYINDWAGSEAVIERFRFRLGRPNYPGDKMRITGAVKQADTTSDGTRMTLEINGDNSEGSHISCEVEVLVPAAVLAKSRVQAMAAH